jgi:hypothetical protein
VRLLGVLVTLAGGLALLARFLTAALLLTGLLTRRLILLAGLVLVRHVVSFHGNTIATAQSPRRSDKTKTAVRMLPLCDGQPDTFGFEFLHSFSLVNECAELNDDSFGVTRRAYA